MEQVLTTDLINLLHTDKQILDKLITNINYCICSYAEQMALNNEQVCKIDIGIGTIILNLEEDAVHWYFSPSEELEKNIIFTLENQQNPLTAIITRALINQLNNFYDRMF